MAAMTKPSAKQMAASGGVALSIAIILAWGAGLGGVDVPAEIVAAVSTVIGFIARQIGIRDATV